MPASDGHGIDSQNPDFVRKNWSAEFIPHDSRGGNNSRNKFRAPFRAPFLAIAVIAVNLPPMAEQIFESIKNLLATPEPAEPGPGPRIGVETESALNQKLDSLFQKNPLAPQQQQLIRSLILLWHDHLDASHTISQGIENTDGSFVHAIMHRREPDFGNSKYWWRRVGAHPAFPEIAARVGTLLKQRGAGELAKKLLPGGKWDAFAFVDACEAWKETDLLREIQRIEFEVLLNHFTPLETPTGGGGIGARSLSNFQPRDFQ